MKTIIRITTLLILAAMALPGKAQVFVCAGTSTVITAVNSSALSNPSYSMNPGAITSSNPSFVITPSVNTVYTLYVTGTNTNAMLATTSITVSTVIFSPVYSLTSANGFSLGCGTASICPVQITAQGLGGGTASYTFIPPGGSTVLPTGSLSSISPVNVNVPGIWQVAVRDNMNSCTIWGTVAISQNITPPVISTVFVSQTTLSCANPTALAQVAPDPSLSFEWWPTPVQGHSLAITANTLNPYQYPLLTLTLVVTDNNNLCQSNTIIPVYQNVFPPNSIIGGPVPAPCSNSIILTNMSTTGILPSTGFSTIQPVVAMLWEAPVSQPTVSYSTTYTAQASGIYTMTVMDLNNGCISTGTYAAVVGPTAAFVHTITGSQAIFNDASNAPSSGITWFWDFGDGNTSTLQNPVHYYQYSGAYLVKFAVINNTALCTDTVIQSVNISGAPCSASSNFSMVPTGTPQVWNVIPDYPWNVTAASWSWGDGSSSSTLYTSHQYASAGTYTICLTVTISCGDTSTSCSSYNVYKGSGSNLMLQVNVVAPELISGLVSNPNEEQFSWNIAPNPNAGAFSLNLSSALIENTQIMISDLTGRVVYDQTIASPANTVSVQNTELPSGMYFVTLQSGQYKLTKRMVIQH